ncbi:citrate synthase, partial [Gregarina niphandrodes]
MGVSKHGEGLISWSEMALRARWCRSMPQVRWFWSPARIESETNEESQFVRHVANKTRARLAERAQLVQQFKQLKNVCIKSVSAGDVVGGMRGVPSLIWETSVVDPGGGIEYRDLELEEVITRLPKLPGARYPSAEALFHLLLTGDVPSSEDHELMLQAFRPVQVSKTKNLTVTSNQATAAINPDPVAAHPTLCARVDAHTTLEKVVRAINTTSCQSHPMSQLVMGVIGAEYTSLMAKEYEHDSSPDTLWKNTLIDGLKL